MPTPAPGMIVKSKLTGRFYKVVKLDENGHMIGRRYYPGLKLMVGDALPLNHDAIWEIVKSDENKV